MQTLICERPGYFKYAEATKPSLEKGRAVLKVRRIGICGTDLHAFEGTQPYFNYPRILGHELACEIIDIEPGTNFAVGDIVTIIPYFSCGHCMACRNGRENCCVALQVLGVHMDGGMAEYLQAPVANLLQDKNLSLDQLALVEPLSIGAHAVRRAEVRSGEYVLVVGAGPIGLAVMEFARIAGAQVIAMDVNEQRLWFCKEYVQVKHVINPSASNPLAQLQEITGNYMPAVVVDASGNLNAIEGAFQYMAHGGRYVLVGLQKKEISFSHPEFHKREATLMSSRNANRSDFEHVIQCIKIGLLNPAAYITHRVSFNELAAQFNLWLNPASGVIKAMVDIE